MFCAQSRRCTWLQNGAAAGCCMTWFRTLRQRNSGCPCLRAAMSLGDSAKDPPFRFPLLPPCTLLCLRRDAAHSLIVLFNTPTRTQGCVRHVRMVVAGGKQPTTGCLAVAASRVWTCGMCWPACMGGLIPSQIHEPSQGALSAAQTPLEGRTWLFALLGMTIGDPAHPIVILLASHACASARWQYPALSRT